MRILASTELPTRNGNFRFIAFGEPEDEFPHVALFCPSSEMTQDVRIHSECMTGDVFGSSKCDCGPQLETALERFGSEGGLLIYLRQEGRGIGLVEKIKAYELQRAGLDTIDANIQLGHGADERTYEAAVWLMNELNVKSIRLHSNNPEKVQALLEQGIEVVERISLAVGAVPENSSYLETKRLRMGHFFDRKP
jgi:3,4-dihydroxy 2-butanone 4-phosphate synthase/GTP cyclohydrolase II